MAELSVSSMNGLSVSYGSSVDLAGSSTGPRNGRRNGSAMSVLELIDRENDNRFLLRENGDLASNAKDDEKRNIKRRSLSFWGSLRNVVRFRNAVDVRKKKVSRPMERRDSFMERFTTRQRDILPTQDVSKEDDSHDPRDMKDIGASSDLFVVHPDENFNFYWSMVITAAVIYNWWVIIARQAWEDLQDNYTALWFTLDYTSDFIYLADIVVQLRTGYLEHGILVKDSKKLAIHYVKTKYFKIDVLSLLPMDLLYLAIGDVKPMLRFPRFLKVYRFKQLYYMVETRTAHPNIWRVMNLQHLLFLLIHWFAAIYFVISQSVGFGNGEWAYPEPIGEYGSLTRKYLWCVYWSTLTMTTIGDLPSPEANGEYVFQICSYLIGVFVFATIVGQVGTVVENRNASRMEFEKHLDNTKQYMRTHNVPEEVQRRIQRWYDYTWARGHLTGGGDISNLSLLPDKMKTELALHVNLDTLRKVTIFQECPPEFLHDLVLKMKAFIFTPGDLICRKGEVAREMFIIADGILEVTGEAGEVFTTLKAGDFFGEIGMLNLDKESGANKRTADVRSMGYSELFTLSKEDVLTAIKDFPKAQKILEEFGRKRLQHEKSKISKDHSGDAESRPIIGVTIERAPEDESAFESVTTTVERINSAEIHQWASQQELRTTGTSRNELDAPIVFRQRLGSNDSDHSSTARLIAELYPSPASSDAEKKQSDILKNKLQVRRSSRRSRRGSWKSVSANEDELECQISDITLSMQDVLHKKLMKYHQEIEHLRNNIRDMESQMQLIETENQKKDCRIEELQTLLKEPKQCDCKDGSPGTRDVNTHISATDVQDLLPSVSD